MGKNKGHLFFLLIIFNFFLQAQERVFESESAVNKIETFLLKNQLDSVRFYISQQKQTPYIQSLNRIFTNNNPSYLDYYQFISSLGNQPGIDYRMVSNYINTQIKAPSVEGDINLDYVNIKWLQVSKLRDEASIGEASNEQDLLESYIAQFDPENPSTQKSQLLQSTHKIVLYQIQEDVENGKALCLSNLEKARELGDSKLEIIFLYHLCDFYIIERKLDAYIEASEQSLDIEAKLAEKTSYYEGTIIHLLDAYIFKGGYEARVETLLKLLFDNPETSAQSFSLYAKYMATLNPESSKIQSIFKQFDAVNVIDFCKKIENLGENVLNQNDYFHVLNEASSLLRKFGHYNESLDYKDKCVVLIKKIYSQDLSQSLSSFKTKQVLQEKQFEVEYEKERSNLIIVIASLIAGLLLVVSLFLWRKQQQSKLLATKNIEVNQALKDKELLVKEVHHRVKNNFQIIASLLELQSKGIKDKNALDFANDIKNRFKSMALIHQELYQCEDGLIDFEKYLHLLINEISSLYSREKKVDTHVKVSNLFFDVDTAIPLALMVNELITNAYKYAFSNEFNGPLEIEIDKVDKTYYVLRISDNGPGMPENFNINNAKSFGLKLVNRLVKQCQGSFTFTNSKGAYFEIMFKDLHSRKIID